MWVGCIGVSFARCLSAGLPGVSLVRPVRRSMETCTWRIARDHGLRLVALARDLTRSRRGKPHQAAGLFYIEEPGIRAVKRRKHAVEVKPELEQLRFLEYGVSIRVDDLRPSPPTLDVTGALLRVRQLFSVIQDPA